MTLLSIFFGAIGPWQIILILVVILLLFLFPFLLIFYKRNEPEHNLPIWAKLLLIIPSLTWVGIITSLYILLRKKDFGKNKTYKFNSSTRNYAIFLLIMSIGFSIFQLIPQY